MVNESDEFCLPRKKTLINVRCRLKCLNYFFTKKYIKVEGYFLCEELFYNYVIQLPVLQRNLDFQTLYIKRFGT